MIIEFQARWKEMLDGRIENHRFTVELTMGQLHVYFPSKEKWEKESPSWARDIWETAQVQAHEWSKENKIPFSVDEHAWVDFWDEDEKS